jgi:hypothetical protein
MAIKALFQRHPSGVIFAVVVICSILVRPGETSRMQVCNAQNCHNEAQGVVNPPSLTPLLDYTGRCLKDGQVTPGRLSSGSFCENGHRLPVAESESAPAGRTG